MKYLASRFRLYACIRLVDVACVFFANRANNLYFIKALFRLKMKNFLSVTSDVSEGCQEGFLETNKKNKLYSSSGNYKTNLLSIINLSLACLGYYST